MTDLELVKSKLDIVELIGSYVPDVQRAGSNFRARCPFHNEKTPSFMINPSLQIYKCFGCGKAGDAISFIEEIERVEFPEALKIAAEKAGVQLTGSFSGNNKKESLEKKRILEANLLTAKLYNYILKTHEKGLPGREYAQKRKIDGKRIEDFMIGFAPNSSVMLKNFLISKGFNEKELIKFGLLVERNGKNVDKFKNRLLQPIFNVQGDIIGFSGRYIGTSKLAPKYLNSPETIVYKKNEILYGLYQAKESIRKSNFIILVEGNIDILSSHRVGINNIAAPLGTAFTPNQAKLIQRFCDEVYFCFDTDDAGTKALIRGIAIVEQTGLKHKVINISGYQDADELICKVPDDWDKKVKEANDSVEYLIKKLSEDLDLGSALGKSKFRDRILPVLNSIKDEVTLAHYIKEVALILEISPENIFKNLKSEIKYKEKETYQASDESSLIYKRQNNQFETYFLAFLINLLDHKVLKEIPEEIFSSEIYREIFKVIRDAKSDYDPGALAETLHDSLKSEFKEIYLIDLPQGDKAKYEFKKLYYSLMKRFYESKLSQIRIKLSKDEENVELINEMNNTLKLISLLEKTRGSNLF